jgi:osmotically-inducible protein OsmY
MSQRDEYRDERDRDEGRYGARDEGRYGSHDQGRWQWGRGAGGEWDQGRRGPGAYGRGYGQGYDWGRDRPGREPYGFGQHSHWQDPFARPEDTHYYGTGAAGFGGPGYTGGAAAYGSGRRDLGQEFESEYSDESALSYERGEYPRRQAQQRRFARGPKGYQRSDERIKEDISERLMQSHQIDSSDVTVEVKGGMVTLEGTVPHRYMRHAIENIADSCLGVQDIDNRVRVKSQQEQGQGQSQTTSSLGGTSVGGTSSAPSTATRTRQ